MDDSAPNLAIFNNRPWRRVNVQQLLRSLQGRYEAIAMPVKRNFAWAYRSDLLQDSTVICLPVGRTASSPAYSKSFPSAVRLSAVRGSQSRCKRSFMAGAHSVSAPRSSHTPNSWNRLIPIFSGFRNCPDTAGLQQLITKPSNTFCNAISALLPCTTR